ncbi:MAG: peptidoglycan-binding domain-containing protein [Flavobacteriales bacterium]
MKQIGKVLGVILILILGFYGYKAYKRQNMPQEALVENSNEIDTEYHNLSLLYDYYELTNDMNALSKTTWYNMLEDIRNSQSTDPDFILEQNKFAQKSLIRQRIESKLIQSKKLKENKSYDNFDVFQLETRNNYSKLEKNNFVIFSRGDEGENIEVFQEMLNKLGYDIIDDGFFKQETEMAVKKYQKSKNKPTTGYVDSDTYQSIVKEVIRK